MNAGNDSPEAIAFMTKFTELKTELKKRSKDNPNELIDLAVKEVSVKDLCVQLQEAARILKSHERRSKEPCAVPVNPAFQKAWRDYEGWYEHPLQEISLMDWLSAGPGLPIDPFRPRAQRGPAEAWSVEDLLASDRAEQIEAAITFAYSNAGNLGHEDCQDRIRGGCEAYEELTQNLGFDPCGVFRRRALFPFVLVPRHVASKHGSAEPISLDALLQQAHDAFIYGAPYAAIALMRSILEKILRDHYGAAEGKLYKLIDQALHFKRQKDAMHRIRMLGNAILHWDDEKGAWEKKFLSGTQEEQEKRMVLHLLALRKLIEEAPKHH